MIQLGTKSEDGPSTRQKVIAKCMWLVSTCRNAIIVVATGGLGFWFVAAYGQSPVRLMGTYPHRQHDAYINSNLQTQTYSFCFVQSPAENSPSG